MTLVIMAAGMGSRFGGLKQVAPMGPNDEFLIDYSIYDCLKYGFDKVVFIIKKENYEIFKTTIGSRVDQHIKVEYVFQDMSEVPSFVKVPEERVKPWGTAHAIYCCQHVVKDNFAIINADDFYGEDAFKTAANYLKANHNPHEFAMVGYEINNTLTENGAVKRGVCFDESSYLNKIIESSVTKEDNQITCTPLDNSTPFIVQDNQLVSMNMFLFTPYIFDLLNQDIITYFHKSTDLTKGEFLIPDVVFNHIKSKDITVKVLRTNALWHGVTYKEDTASVRKAIKKLVEDKIYPNHLWQ